jgi:hypothetical protein
MAANVRALRERAGRSFVDDDHAPEPLREDLLIAADARPGAFAAEYDADPGGVASVVKEWRMEGILLGSTEPD